MSGKGGEGEKGSEPFSGRKRALTPFPKRVYTALDPIDAHLVKGLLEAEGIAVEIRGEALFGGRGELPLTEDTLPSLWVREERAAARALSVLRGHREGGSASMGPNWCCPECGESLEPQFSACWRCIPMLAEGPPIGIVAALPAEAACLGRAADPWIVISGMGQARAHEAALSLAARGAVALVSFGTAGALAPGLRAGDLVLADGVLSGSVLIESDRVWQARLAGRLAGRLGVHTGTILHADAVVAAPSDKSRLFLSTAAVAVDMESAGVARAAAERDVPWLGVRAIVDAAGQSIPALALGALGQDGCPRLGALVAGLARAPSDLAPLLRLGLGFRAARVTLERLVRLVGPGMGFSASGRGSRS